MGMKEYVLWGGGALVVLVVAHGLWQAWRSRRRRNAGRAEISPDADSGTVQQVDIVGPPVLSDVEESAAAPAAAATTAPDDFTATEGDATAADVATGATDEVAVSDPAAGEREGLAPRIGDPSAGEHGGPAVEPEDDGQSAKRGRRVVIPGKRTEPTVPRNDHLFKVRTAPPEQDRVPPAPPGLDEVVVMWVVAKAGASFNGQDLVKALADNGLRYDNDALFRKFDVDSGEELFSVVNGLEPGTFDLSDLDVLSTPRIVMLLSLVNATTGLAAFSEMLDAAQDISISLGGELRDENMGPITGQTIEHYRQRITDYKRKSLRK